MAAKLRAELEATEEAVANRRLRRGQLVIVDEASLAGTLVLDELVSAARDAGAKVLLVGDWAQLGSIEAGGAFSLLARDRADRVPELTDVRRFEEDWERQASVGCVSDTWTRSIPTSRRTGSPMEAASSCSRPCTGRGRPT